MRETRLIAVSIAAQFNFARDLMKNLIIFSAVNSPFYTAPNYRL
jgi:hypothetical protein